MQSNILVVASSGGHLTQALGATEMLDNRVIATNRAGIANLKNNEHEIITRDTTKNIWIHFLNLLKAINVFYKFKISGVFCSGGPMCLPFMLLAKILGVKIYYLDTMSRMNDLSNTGKLVYKMGLFDKFVVQWPEVKNHYQKADYYGSIFDINYSRDS